METGAKVMATKKEKWDGRSRPSDDNYRKRWNEIFGKRKKTLHEELMKGYEEEKRMYEEEEKMNEKDDYFDSKSVKQMMDEME